MTDEEEEVFEMAVDGEPEEEEEAVERPAKKKKAGKGKKAGKAGKKGKAKRKKPPRKRRPRKPAGQVLKGIFDTSTGRGKILVLVVVAVVVIAAYGVYSMTAGDGILGDDDDDSPPNQRPSALFTMDPAASAELGEIIYLIALDSSDQDGVLEHFRWDVDDSDGFDWEEPDLEGEQVEWFYESTGSYTITLQVEDNDGATDETSRVINVTQQPAQITMTSAHYDPLLGAAPETFTLSISAISASGDAGIENFTYMITQTGALENGTIVEGDVSSLGTTSAPVGFTDFDDDGEFSPGDFFVIYVESLDPQPTTGDMFILAYTAAPGKTSSVMLS